MRRKHRAGEIDLPQHLRPAVIEVERRTGDRNAVIGIEARRVRQARVLVGGETNIDRRIGGDFPEY